MSDKRRCSSDAFSDARDCKSCESLLKGIQAVAMDIEGTTTPITYVKDTVFPFIRENVRSYLEDCYVTEDTQADVELLRKYTQDNDKIDKIPDKNEDRVDVISSVLSVVNILMDSDSKITALKQLQGHVWQHALKSGKKLTGLDVYDDVVEGCRWMKQQGLDLYIYSSGSILAQKLLFGYSSHGDLLHFFSGHFDTTVGAKTEKESYLKIIEEIKKPADEILFLTDVPAEANAALEAGMRVCIVIRDGNKALTDDERSKYTIIHSFSQLYHHRHQLTEEPTAKLSKVETSDTKDIVD